MTVNRPIMLYTAETRPDISKTKKLFKTTEMRVLEEVEEAFVFLYPT